jgi:hypothetical protein
MGYYVWINPANQRQKYTTMLASDPNVPAGYILTSGSDGTADQPQQTIKAGINSGGFPQYGDLTSNAAWPNGILGGYQGGKRTSSG